METHNISYAVATIKKGEGRALKAGGAWIFDNEIESVMGDFSNGDIIAVRDFDGYPMGYGFININSKIRIRMLSRKADQQIDEAFIRLRVQNAYGYRKSVMNGGNNSSVRAGDMNCCRLIFGEADNLPGLVVDKYDDVLVVESLALGIDRLKLPILRALLELLSEDGYTISAVYERSDAPVRKKEGMMPRKGIIPIDEIWQISPGAEASLSEQKRVSEPIEIVENNVRYNVDVVNGQKTGFFLDQKYNRLAMQRVVHGLLMDRINTELKQRKDSMPDEPYDFKILDCFTHMGTFALNCGYSAKQVINSYVTNISEVVKVSVTGLDISEYAVGQATENARLNDLDNIVSFRAANVLDELPKLYNENENFDVVILDPPAFTKSKEATKNAMKGYREINMKGMKLVKDGGYLATCSCSHFMTQELFTQVIGQAAKAVHKRLRQVEFRTQAPDHPILWAADESYYLKFYIFQVVDEK